MLKKKSSGVGYHTFNEALAEMGHGRKMFPVSAQDEMIPNWSELSAETLGACRWVTAQGLLNLRAAARAKARLEARKQQPWSLAVVLNGSVPCQLLLVTPRSAFQTVMYLRPWGFNDTGVNVGNNWVSWAGLAEEWQFCVPGLKGQWPCTLSSLAEYEAAVKAAFNADEEDAEDEALYGECQDPNA